MTLRRRPTPEEIEQAFKDDQTTQIRQLLPRIDWHALWADEDEEEWLLYPLIPARRLVALFSGAGIGKSLLMLEIAAGLSTERKVLGVAPTRRYRVLYIDFENDPRGDVRDRLQNMGYGPDDLDHLDYLSFPSLAYLDTPQGASELTAAVEAYASELVVVDTISRAVMGEENDNDTWLNFYKYSGLAMKQRGVAVVRLDHSGKDETKGQRGGSAKAGDVDAIWQLFQVDKDRKFRLVNTKARFQLDAKEVTLIRHDYPLHHTLEDSKPIDDYEGEINKWVALADRENKPNDWGKRRLVEWARTHGFKGRDRIFLEVAARRKHRPEPFKPVDNSPVIEQKAVPEAGHHPIIEQPVPGSGHHLAPDAISPSQSGAGVWAPPGTGLPPNGGARGGVSISTPPGTTRGPEGNGHACPECGWDRFHKAVCSLNPARRVVVDD